MGTQTKKPKLYVVGGKWYCQRIYSDGPVSTRVALGVARDTPEDACAAWVDIYRGCWQVLPAQRTEAGDSI